MMEVTYIAAVVNVIILLALLYPGIRNLLKTRSTISASLLAFTLLFLVQNIVAIYFHLTISYTSAVELEVATLTVIQTAGFGTLLWATYK
jgi:hypothetical protein